MRWIWCPFSELEVADLYAGLALRSRVFVVEQNCVYLDCDGKDDRAWHLLGYRDGQLAAYMRAFAPGAVYKEASLGRVVSSPEARGTGAGRELIRVGLEMMEAEFGRHPVRISAQAYLQRFYESFGFTIEGEGYLEDGIPHFQMVRR